MYGRIVAADTDNTGTISVRNLFDFIRSMSAEVKAAKGNIPISDLNPDTDGGARHAACCFARTHPRRAPVSPPPHPLLARELRLAMCAHWLWRWL